MRENLNEEARGGDAALSLPHSAVVIAHESRQHHVVSSGST